MSIIYKDFDAHYHAIWGERWPSLRQALLRDKNYVALHSYYASEGQDPYYLDIASRDIIEVLQVQQDESVLDMCAAPGGKSLVLLDKLKGTGALWSNDKERHARLRRVLQYYYPQDALRITAKDGRSLGQKCAERFDAILVDAPCSSEWHWLKEPKLLEHWRPTRSKRLAIDQYALLASALTLLKIGGRCLYVTCAINPMENDKVIEKALARWGDAIEVDPVVPSYAEASGRGFYVLPDRSIGGPLYGCLLWRRADKKGT